MKNQQHKDTTMNRNVDKLRYPKMFMNVEIKHGSISSKRKVDFDTYQNQLAENSKQVIKDFEKSIEELHTKEYLLDNFEIAIGYEFSYKDNIYGIIGIHEHKCRVTREWYQSYEYASKKTGKKYSRCCKEFLDRFERLRKLSTSNDILNMLGSVMKPQMLTVSYDLIPVMPILKPEPNPWFFMDQIYKSTSS